MSTGSDLVNAIMKSSSGGSTSAPATSSSSNAIAQYLMANANGGGHDAKKSSQHRSILNKVFDAISTPLYAMEHIVDETAHSAYKNLNDPSKNLLEKLLSTGGDYSKASLEGIAGNTARLASDTAQLTPLVNSFPGLGKGLQHAEQAGLDFADKVSPRKLTSDLLHEAGVDNKLARYGGGFIGDVLLDPTTYVPGLDVVTILKKAREAKLAALGVNDVAKVAHEIEPLAADSAKALDTAAATGEPESVSGFGKIIHPPLEAEAGLKPSALEELNLPVAERAVQGTDLIHAPTDLLPGAVRPAVSEGSASALERSAKFADNMRAAKMAKKGIVSDGKGAFSVQAGTKALKDIEDGITPVFNDIPVPVALNDKEAALAVKVAETQKNRFFRKFGDAAKEMKPTEQHNLYNAMYSAAVKVTSSEPAAKALALRLLRTGEDHLLNTYGIQGVHSNGMRARLSDIVHEVGPRVTKDINNSHDLFNAFFSASPRTVGNPVVAKAVNNAVARRSLVISQRLGNLSQHIADAKVNLFDEFPRQEALAQLIKAKQAAKADLVAAGATKAEIKASMKHLDEVAAIGDSALEREMILQGTRRAVTKSEKVAAQKAANTAVLEDAGTTLARESTDATGKNTYSMLGSMMSTWSGVTREMKVIADDAFKSGESFAVDRAIALRRMSMNYTAQELTHGFELARSGFDLGMVTNPKLLETASFFKDYLTHILGSTGMAKTVDVNGSEALYSHMVMSDMNREMKALGENFKFTNGNHVVGTLPDGSKIVKDFSENGDGWAASWFLAEPEKYKQDPISFLHHVDLAAQKVMAHYRIQDGLATKFGSKVADEIRTTAVKGIPRLEGYFFHPQIASEFEKLSADFSAARWHPKSPAVRFAAQATRLWKTQVTIYYPAHHIRNMIGDSWNMWVKGHNNPEWFGKAGHILRAEGSQYKDALRKADNYSAIAPYLSHETLDVMESGKLIKPEEVANRSKVLINRKGVELTSAQIHASALNRGLLPHFNTIEDIYGATAVGTKYGNTPQRSVAKFLEKPYGEKAHAVATSISEHREHFVRLAHYMSAIDKDLAKNPKKDLKAIFDDAAHEVRASHPDGSDLTQFEQKVRIVVPFYSWTRKEIPLLMQALIERPAKITAYPKAQHALAGMLGVDSGDGINDPFPVDQLFPDWIRATGIGPVANAAGGPFSSFFAKFGATAKLVGGGASGYTQINPSNPFDDTVTQLLGFGGGKDAARALLNTLNPGLNIPVSLMSNQTFSGQPITKNQGGKGTANYLANQIPIVGTLTRAGAEKEGIQGLSKQNMTNLLTALGIRGTAPYIKSAQFEERDRKRFEGGN